VDYDFGDGGGLLLSYVTRAKESTLPGGPNGGTEENKRKGKKQRLDKGRATTKESLKSNTTKNGE